MKINPRNTEIIIHRGALTSIYDECDRYDADETGGRLLGGYAVDKKGNLTITVTGVIEPGPGARRTATSFFQDGEWQENVFRGLENRHPEMEHLGNWHTHHVNGYPTLSGGDKQTYHRIVNHKNHNTDFFYALLVTQKLNGRGDDRYAVRHFVLARKQSGEHEVPQSRITVVDKPVIWPTGETMQHAHATPSQRGASSASSSNDQRARDSALLTELAPGLKPFMSKETGSVYWRGKLPLIDGSAIDMVVAETNEGAGAYHVMVKNVPTAAEGAVGEGVEFRSAAEAVITVERRLNEQIFRGGAGRVDLKV